MTQSSAAHLKAHAAAQLAAGYVPKATTVVNGNTSANSGGVITKSLITSTPSQTSPSCLSPPSSRNASIHNGNLLWKLELDEVQNWIKRTHVLFPKSPKRRLNADGNPLQAGTIRGGELSGDVNTLVLCLIKVFVF